MGIASADTTIDGPHGPLRLRHYVGEHDHGPALVWVHGGAFAFGDISMPESDWVARQLATRGITVVTVDYQLSPKIDLTDARVAPSGAGVHFPVASDEVVAAFNWTTEHLNEFGCDPSLLSIGGASAGANLAVSALLQLRDARGPQARSGVLAYPSLHAVVPPMSTEFDMVVRDLPPILRFPPEIMRVIHLNYVGDEAVLGNPYAFPGGHDSSGLPPIFILNSDRDPLRASGEAFASELGAAGVDTLVIREVGTQHGHLNDPAATGAVESIERMAAWLHPGPFLGTRHSDQRSDRPSGEGSSKSSLSTTRTAKDQS